MKNLPSYLCSVCKNKFAFKDVKYSKDGKELVCKGCYQKISEKKEKKQEVKGSAIEEKAIKLICVKCRYKFSYKKGSRVKLICPYCGSNKLMRDDTTADKIIQEVSMVPNRC